MECVLLGCFRSFPFASTPLRLEPPLELNALKMLNFGIIKGASWESARTRWSNRYIYVYVRHEEAMPLSKKNFAQTNMRHH